MPTLVAAVTPLGLIPPISRPIRVVNTSTVERLSPLDDEKHHRNNFGKT